MSTDRQDAIDGANLDFSKIKALTTVMMPQLARIGDAFRELHGLNSENALIVDGLMWLVKDVYSTADSALDQIQEFSQLRGGDLCPMI